MPAQLRAARKRADESVTPEELANAREMGRFAKLRAEAAARKAEQAKEQARLDAIAALVDEIRASGTDRKQLADALDTFDTALRDLLALAAAHNAQLTQWRTRAAEFGVTPGSSEAGLTVPRYHGAVEVDGQALSAVPIGSFISALMHRATTNDRSVKHMGQPLAVRCQEWHDSTARPVDLAKALPTTTVKAGA